MTLGKKLGKRILMIFVGLGIGLMIHMYLEKREEERFPMEDEFSILAKEFYRYYLINQEFPTDLSFLSETSKQILQIHSDQFTWKGPEEGLHLEFQTPQKIGWRNQWEMKGLTISPKTIDNNANLFRDSGILF